MGLNRKITASDLTKSALQRMINDMLTSRDGGEESIADALDRQARGGVRTPPSGKRPMRNDLADLHEEMHGKYTAPMVEDDDLDQVDDFDDDNGVQTARVQGPPSKKPVPSRGGDEDAPSGRRFPQAGRRGQDQDLPTGRNVPRVSASTDEDMPNAKAPRFSQRGDEDKTGPKRPPRFSQRGDEDMTGSRRLPRNSRGNDEDLG